jgi:hypothetical protein
LQTHLTFWYKYICLATASDGNEQHFLAYSVMRLPFKQKFSGNRPFGYAALLRCDAIGLHSQVGCLFVQGADVGQRCFGQSAFRLVFWVFLNLEWKSIFKRKFVLKSM